MNEHTIRKWYDIFKGNNELVEIRALGKNERGYPQALSGYFTNSETIIENIRNLDSLNIYWTLNEINDACYSRSQRDRMEMKTKAQTSDSDITRREWVLIDIDCERPSDTNATDEEKAEAHKVTGDVYKYLKSQGFNEPVVCDSANGYHLLYRCDMPNTDDVKDVVKDFLYYLDISLSTERAHIDVSVSNAARICKLYGCVSRKGSDSPERPQRESTILYIPEEIKVNDIAYFKKIAKMLPKEEQPTKSNNWSREKFDVEAFMSEHNIRHRNGVKSKNGTKWVLDECPFNCNHKAPDAAVFQMESGALGFRCLHSSCSSYSWSDFRKHFDPSWEPGQKRQPQPNEWKVTPQPQEKQPNDKAWLKMSEVDNYKFDPNDFILSGYPVIDNMMMGFKRGHVSVWSGYRGSAKSTVLNMLILNAAQQGARTALWTGELDNREVKTWLYLQAAGKTYNRPSQFNANYYYTPADICRRIDPWIDRYFRLYNQEYSNRIDMIISQIRSLKESDFKLDVVILDNLMTLQLDTQGTWDQYDSQTRMMQNLHNLAIELNIHIHLVCHPNKSGTFLRPNNISGSGHIPDFAQNILIVHRVNNDFHKNASEFFDNSEISRILVGDPTNVIEICKCREKGKAVGRFVPMWFEDESNRLLSDPSEFITYNWNESASTEQDIEFIPLENVPF